MRLVIAVLAVLLVPASSAFAAVTVSRAEMNGSEVRLEGSAIASRAITVDGTAMGTADSGGRFQIRRAFTPPADCTVDVNDGSPTPRSATLSGCTVTSPPPPLDSGPPAPPPIAPAEGAPVTVPFTISWAAVSDPSGIAGYNWQVSTTPAFTTLALADSTAGTVTQASVGGLTNGTYYWRVQAASNGFVQGAWSAARSFVVTGAGPDSPGTPVLAPLRHGTAYHPMEHFPVEWSAVPGAASYVMELARDASFPQPHFLKVDNIPDTNDGLTFDASLQGTFYIRVYAVDANRVRGIPSNIVSFTISYNAPIGPAPTLASPANGAVVKLPFTVDWNDVPNPQDLGYEIQLSRSADFGTLVDALPGRTASEVTYSSLAAGQYFWRVRHTYGDASPTTAAMSAFSEVRSFTVEDTPLAVTSVSLTRDSAYSGQEIVGSIQLSRVAPAGGTTVGLSSSNPAAVPVPSSVQVDAGLANGGFRFHFGQVTEPTAVTITATVGGSSATFLVTVNPPSLLRVEASPPSVTGGSVATVWVHLNGAAPPGGLTVTMAGSSPLARPPATFTIPAGFFYWAADVPTSEVTADASVTISATYRGVTASAPLTLRPGLPPDTLTLTPSSVTGGAPAATVEGRVSVAAPANDRDVRINLSSSHPDIVSVPPFVEIGRFAVAATFFAVTRPVTAPTTVTISATGAGVTKTATLTVNAQPPPPPPGPLAAPTLLSPASDARFNRNVLTRFDWSDMANAARYRIQVSSSSGFTTTVVDQQVTPSEASLSFTATGDRFWRVQAINSAGGGGTWSASRRFRVR